jgi:hypothetical protein
MGSAATTVQSARRVAGGSGSSGIGAAVVLAGDATDWVVAATGKAL